MTKIKFLKDLPMPSSTKNNHEASDRNLISNECYKFSGSKTIVVSKIEKNVELKKSGSGDLKVNGEIEDNVKIYHVGSGDISLLNSIGQNFQLIHTGSGDVTFNGDLGAYAHIKMIGAGSLDFKGALCDDIIIEGEITAPILFSVPPSEIILEKIKKAQELALISETGFSGVGCLWYKQGPGWLRVIKNNQHYFFTGRHFKYKNNQMYIDEIPVPEYQTTSPQPEFVRKIDDFSKQHPFLFLTFTLGLGFFWYVGMLLRDGINISSGGVNITMFTTADSASSDINIEVKPIPSDSTAYYLADFSVVKAVNITPVSACSSSKILHEMLRGEKTTPSKHPFPNSMENIKMDTKEEKTVNDSVDITHCQNGATDRKWFGC